MSLSQPKYHSSLLWAHFELSRKSSLWSIGLIYCEPKNRSEPVSSSPDSFHLKKEDKRRNRLEGSLLRTFKYLIFCNKSSITFHNSFKSLKSREHFSTIVAILMKNWILNSSLKSCTCCNMRLAKLKVLLVFNSGPFWGTMVEITLNYYEVVDSNPNLWYFHNLASSASFFFRASI